MACLTGRLCTQITTTINLVFWYDTGAIPRLLRPACLARRTKAPPACAMRKDCLAYCSQRAYATTKLTLLCCSASSVDTKTQTFQVHALSL